MQVVFEHLERKAVENLHVMKLVCTGASGSADHCSVGAGPGPTAPLRSQDVLDLNGKHF